MVTTQKEKQRQFGKKLLIIALIVAVFFSVWYWLEKSGQLGSTDQTTTTQTAEK